jgi:hypothetical protein
MSQIALNWFEIKCLISFAVIVATVITFKD